MNEAKRRDKIAIGDQEVEVKSDSFLGRLYSLPPRLFGFILLLLGLIYGKFYIYDELEKARRHSPEVNHSPTMTAASIFCVMAGLVLAVGGKRAGKLLTRTGETRKNTWLDNALLVVAAALTFGLMRFVDILFQQSGYR